MREKFVDELHVTLAWTVQLLCFLQTQLLCAKAWSGWELRTAKLICDPAVIEARLEDLEWTLSFARIER